MVLDNPPPPRRRGEPASPPTWIKPQLAPQALVKAAPDGPGWLHEIKFDGYRMHARLEAGRVNILTRRGNDWTAKYPAIAEALLRLPTNNAYLDGELCGVLPDGRTAFNLIQNASDTGQGSLVFFLFEEFVVVGWSDPEGSRHRIGSLLLGYYTPDGCLIYAGRAGTGMSVAELERVWHRLRPLAVDKMLLSEPPPRGSRFGSPLVLSRVHWVRPEMVIEVSYVEWTPDKLLRHVVYLGEREDKPAIDVRRDRP